MSYLFLDGPAMISFSGGRTSAYMLHEILRVNNGLPRDVYAVFANTGKEKEVLNPWEGNCDFCFQKGKGIRKRIIRDNPEVPGWWDDREREQNGWFDKRDLVSELIEQVRISPTLFDAPEDYEYDVECGTHCEAAE